MLYNDFMFKYFKWSYIVAIIGTLFAYFWGNYRVPNSGFKAVFIVLVLSILEVSLSFDNAVVNAMKLEKMEKIWQHRFLTWGIAIAVFGMRFLFPLLVVSIFAFYSFNFIFSLICNYRSNFVPTLIGLVPVFMFMLITVTILIALYYYLIKNRKDSYFVRQYSIICGSFALVGVIFSILSGTVAYHGFFKRYIVFGYPFGMLIIHTLLLAVFVYLAVISIIDIKKNSPEKTFEFEKHHNLKMFGIVILTLYALERLGGFTLLPVYFSSYDGIYVLPYYIQLIVPAFILFVFLMHRNNIVSKKVSWIMLLVSTLYSVASLIYIIVISHDNYPIIVNPLTPVLQFERLITFPIGTIILYGVSILIPIALGIRWLIITISSKKGH